MDQVLERRGVLGVRVFVASTILAVLLVACGRFLEEHHISFDVLAWGLWAAEVVAAILGFRAWPTPTGKTAAIGASIVVVLTLAWAMVWIPPTPR